MVADEQTNFLWVMMMLVNEVCVCSWRIFLLWWMMHHALLNFWNSGGTNGSIWQHVLTSCWWRIYDGDDDDDVAELIRGCWCRINDDVVVVVVELWLLCVMKNLWWWWWWRWGGGGGGGKKAAAYKSQISKIFMIHDGSNLWQLTESKKLERKPAKVRMRIQEKRQEHGKMKMIIDEEERWREE